MPIRSTMGERSRVSKQAAAEIEAWLKKNPITREVRNVEDDRRYRQLDIDLVWKTTEGDETIEIKGDTYHTTGNFFFETLSNRERNTLGCFMYTEADFVYYYFVTIKKLYVLPMPKIRIWFQEHMNEFRERATETAAGRDSFYTTVGRLVPIARVLKDFPDLIIHTL